MADKETKGNVVVLSALDILCADEAPESRLHECIARQRKYRRTSEGFETMLGANRSRVAVDVDIVIRSVTVCY